MSLQICPVLMLFHFNSGFYFISSICLESTPSNVLGDTLDSALGTIWDAGVQIQIGYMQVKYLTYYYSVPRILWLWFCLFFSGHTWRCLGPIPRSVLESPTVVLEGLAFVCVRAWIFLACMETVCPAFGEFPSSLGQSTYFSTWQHCESCRGSVETWLTILHTELSAGARCGGWCKFCHLAHWFGMSVGLMCAFLFF